MGNDWLEGWRCGGPMLVDQARPPDGPGPSPAYVAPTVQAQDNPPERKVLATQMSEIDRDMVTRGLIGPDADRARLYHTNPLFHATVDAFVEMLDAVMVGFEIKADEERKRLQERFEQALKDPVRVLLPLEAALDHPGVRLGEES